MIWESNLEEKSCSNTLTSPLIHGKQDQVAEVPGWKQRRCSCVHPALAQEKQSLEKWLFIAPFTQTLVAQ
jgi:hypothetical protein